MVQNDPKQIKENNYGGCSVSAAGLYYLSLKKQNTTVDSLDFALKTKALFLHWKQNIIANFLLLAVVSFSEIDYTNHYNSVSAAEDTNHKGLELTCLFFS